MCNILLAYDGVQVYSKLFGKFICTPFKLPKSCSFVLLVSALCGNPLGAKYSISLYEKKIISKDQCERLLNIASNAGPLFIVGAVGTVMLKSTQLGYILLIANYMSCAAIGLLISPRSVKKNTLSNKDFHELSILPNFGIALRDSIENAIKTTLSIGGYITLFYVIIDIIANNSLFKYLINIIPEKHSYLKDIASAAVLGLIELTKGCFLISQNNMNSVLKIFIIGFFMGFGGLSIITQIYSFMSAYPEFKITLFMKRKVLQGILGGAFSILLYVITYFRVDSQQTMSTHGPYESGYIAVIIILIITPALLHNLRKLFKSS